MALLFVDGCDWGSGFDQLWGGATQPTSSASSRFGVANGAIGNPASSTRTFFPSVASGARVFAGFWFFSTAPASNSNFGYFINAAASEWSNIRILAGGTLAVCGWGGGTTALGTTAASICDSVWHWVEFDFLFANSGQMRVWVDGILVIDTGVIDTLIAGTASIAGFELNSGGLYTNYLDDIVMWDDSGSGLTSADSPIGPVRIQRLAPTSDASVQWTRSTGANNYGVIDEAAPDTTDYVETTTVGHKDRYGLADLTTTPIAVLGVSLKNRAIRTSAAFANYRQYVYTSSTQYSGTTRLVPATAQTYADHWDLNPNGSVAWTPTTVNGLEAGIELTS
jgi:hypothetical protein